MSSLIGSVFAIGHSEYCFEFAPAKGGKKKGKGKKNCEKGIQCGGSCISAKRICRKGLSPDAVVKAKALSSKLGGGGGGSEGVGIASEGMHSEVIKTGEDFLGKKRMAELDAAIALQSPRIKKLESDLAKISPELDRLMDETDPADWGDVFKSDIGKKNSALREKISAEKEKLSQKATTIMEGIRSDLIQKSKLSEAEADAIAANIKINKGATKEISEVEIRKEISDYMRVSGGQGSKDLKKISMVEERAHAASDDGYINIGKNGTIAENRTTLWHELGHFAEADSRYQNTAPASSSWIRARATGTAQPLKQIDASYKDNEIALPDKFVHPYVGKVYADGETEATSMGIQHFTDAKSMATLYSRDPEHFKLTIGLFRQPQNP